MTTPNEHDREVRNAVSRAVATDARTFDEVLRASNGADPRAVYLVYKEALGSTLADVTKPPAGPLARRQTANLLSLLPAPDPMWSQWWFTLDTIASLAQSMWALCAGGAAAFLGAPTVGYYFRHCYGISTVILDVDSDVVKCIANNGERAAYEYDVAASVPAALTGQHTAVLLDPPWYPEITWQFICRARELLGGTGFILCVVPSRLTRPGLISERTSLLNRLLDSGVEIVALETERVHYRVPHFEAQAYADLKEFSARQWRSGDLLIARVSSDSHLAISTPLPPDDRIALSRNPTNMRVFLSKSRVTPGLPSWFEPVEAFKSEVSTRQIPVDEVALWTTDKIGARVKDYDTAQTLLQCWANRESQDETINKLVRQGRRRVEALEVFRQFRTVLSDDGQPESNYRRTHASMERIRHESQSAIAAQPTGRTHGYHEDQFRLGFQRDRDRVLWSPALRRLANKTQVFAIESEGDLRGRLGHSIEVMQLASTIAASFGLDRDLTEAGALVHDIGHCPFGHAGEHALNKTLDEIDSRFGGFNHYEHGLDVVRWLETMYRSPGAGGIPGLNLTNETAECIIKHTFFRTNHPTSQDTLLRASKHQDVDTRSCHLEGQAVRIADKISYLISDLEDGIRMGVFTLDALRTCRLFDRPPIDLTPDQDEPLYERFVSQRGAILKVLMEDVLTASDRQMRSLGSVEDVRNRREYTITFSPDIQQEVTEIWGRLQAGILHKNERVVAANLRAARIVSDLLILYTLAPELVDPRFKNSHEGLASTDYMKWYHGRLGTTVGIACSRLLRHFYDHVIGRKPERQGDNYLFPTKDLVLAKDYVASLTNGMAEREHRRCFGGVAV